ncbi:nucleoplasmin-3 isoform X1 [Nycticebus coucang]|uniref:nucleoplasmin-3 isoform X1 n=1 Tax=Nycticebus coucang TaxID=9470 RepID=UPI00234C1BD6|nr:nucleoplasmin-3 isoform X1 [Nycticebus coucang]
MAKKGLSSEDRRVSVEILKSWKSSLRLPVSWNKDKSELISFAFTRSSPKSDAVCCCAVCWGGVGCELSGHTRSFTFKVEEDDAEHVLSLTMLCLTEGAKDECNVVEVVARNHDHQEIAVPVANLKLSCQPMLSLDDFQLQPPVTFRLKSGSGPVRITGRHQIVTISNDISEEEESEEEAELCPILPAKKHRGKP